MSSYNSFAYFYDSLMNADYNKIASFIDKTIKEEGNGGNLVLDLACGTGNLSIAFADMGYDVVGVDASFEMLSEAMNKPHDFNNPIFLNQTMQELDLFGTIDAAFCTLDSINHIDNVKDVKKAIERVSLFLNDGGLFIFDVNTLYKHQTVLGQNTFVFDTEDVYCVWQNQINNDKSVDILLDFFEPMDNDEYKREQEGFKEYYYDDEFLNNTLGQCGLKIIGIYDDYCFKPISNETERKVFVCRKENK